MSRIIFDALAISELNVNGCAALPTNVENGISRNSVHQRSGQRFVAHQETAEYRVAFTVLLRLPAGNPGYQCRRRMYKLPYISSVMSQQLVVS